MCQLYLFARACNAHTRVHFQNCTWSTVYDDRAYYMALDLAAVGWTFVPLHSLDQEKLQCVIGQVQVLVDPTVLGYSLEVCDDNSESDLSSDECLPVGPFEDDILSHKDVDETVVSTKPCSVCVTLLPYAACVQLSSRQSVQVERLPRSAVKPNSVFKSCKPSKSELYPGLIFRGTCNWTACTVPVDKVSISSKLPGRVFTGNTAPQRNWTTCTVPSDKPSVSSSLPGYVFRANEKQCERQLRSAQNPGHIFKGVRPQSFDVQLRVKRVEVQRPSSSVVVRKFNCLICKDCTQNTHAAVKCHVECDHQMFTCNNAHCIAAFCTASGRDVHAAVHMKKCRVCTLCKQQFEHRFALKRHMVTHSKVRKHRCRKCSRKYFRLQDLKEHLDTSYGATTYSCDQCAYQGQSLRAVRQHTLVHQPPKLKCPDCNTLFHWRSQLAAHACQ